MRRSFLSAGAAIDRELLAMTEAFTDEIVAVPGSSSSGTQQFTATRLARPHTAQVSRPEVCAGVAAL
jgi:hypothetical protein